MSQFTVCLKSAMTAPVRARRREGGREGGREEGKDVTYQFTVCLKLGHDRTGAGSKEGGR